MSEQTKDGGPAFPMPSGPEPRVNSTTHYNEGMTLRDYFAAAALQAMLTAPAGIKFTDDNDNAPASGADFARLAYEFSDAMLKERSK